jgi:hypothetical protein
VASEGGVVKNGVDEDAALASYVVIRSQVDLRAAADLPAKQSQWPAGFKIRAVATAVSIIGGGFHAKI